MLRGKRIMVILSSTLLFSTSGLLSTPFQALATEVVKDNINNEMVLRTDKYGLLINPIQEQFEKDKLELEKKKAEELRLQKEKELEEQKKISIETKEFELTFYSNLDMENYSGCGGITSSGCKLFDGVVASNYYKMNTKIKLEGWGEVTVLDKGSDKYFNNDYRLDVFIPKEPNESDSHYYSRVNKMGKIKVKGVIVK